MGVYLPSSDCPIDVYREYIEELESTIAMLQKFGPTNAHLRAPSTVDDNAQGEMVESMCQHLDLYPVSLSKLNSGPDYTYFSGNRYTTVDYCLREDFENWQRMWCRQATSRTPQVWGSHSSPMVTTHNNHPARGHSPMFEARDNSPHYSRGTVVTPTIVELL